MLHGINAVEHLFFEIVVFVFLVGASQVRAFGLFLVDFFFFYNSG